MAKGWQDGSKSVMTLGHNNCGHADDLSVASSSINGPTWGTSWVWHMIEVLLF